jgi:dTDP-4-amino-4,6-dideoxygalactose transaminase
MPVHLMGKPAEMDTINRIAKKHKLYVIEDAAEAHGAVYKGRNVGTLGDMAAYSLYIAHIITTIEGGVVVTDNAESACILRSLRSHGRACTCDVCVLNTSSAYCPKRFQYGKGEDIRFVFERPGFSCKMNEIEAAVGIGSLRVYNRIIEKRRKNLLTLMSRFKKFSAYLGTIAEEKHERIGPHAFPIIIKEHAPFTRKELVDFLEKNGIDTRALFASIPTQYPAYAFMSRTIGDFPEAEYIGEHGIHIGVHQDLTGKHLDHIIDTIENFLRR